MPTQPYPYQMKLEVLFRDLDAMEHVNSTVYFTYMEALRVKFMHEFGDSKALMDASIVVGEASCRYVSPAFLGEQLLISLGVSRYGNKSFDMLYRIETEDGRLTALGKTVQVMYNYKTEQTFPVPQKLKDRIRAFQGDWKPTPETSDL